ncbi:superoxide dismutase family protein [Stappia indica]|uniref:superoxide dismutase family protein n=1 Tax=Stappia indica TaxID=538381 RepID=UPI001D188BF8|nr:superoxide dismutase family protein [Stappia indica]MCC4245149.1 superoxide dismutase family protein [Stappia indica]
MKTIMIAAGLVALAAVPAAAQGDGSQEANATFIGKDGKETGRATLTGTSDGVLIDLEVSGLPASQWVAFHVHETGTCDASDGHKSAGGHFNPGGSADHGYLAENGPHAGDMPNQWVDGAGTLRAQVFNSMVTLDGDKAIRGKALMIHGGKDDYSSQPSGDAGDRQACAVIE